MSTSETSSTTSAVRPSTEPELKGWLYKWTNYIKGYQKRWFVLSNGNLAYYRNPMEFTASCRGSINLVSAVIHTEDSGNFVVANGGTQTYHLRAMNEVERQKWVTSLELAKVRAIRQMDAEEDDYYDLAADKNELQSILKSLQAKLDNLNTCADVVAKHGSALQRSLIELEQIDNPAEAISKSKAINERATLYRITSSAMSNASLEYMNCAQSHCKKLQKLLHHEHESRLKLEDLVEQLAKQHSHLEQRAIKQQQSTGDGQGGNGGAFNTTENTEDDEFYDAEENNTLDFVVTFPGKAHRIHSSNTPTSSLSAHNVVNSSSESTATAEEASADSPGGSGKINSSNSSSKGQQGQQQQRPKRKLRRRKRNVSNSNNDSGNSNDEDGGGDDDVYTSEEDIQVDVFTRSKSTIDGVAAKGDKVEGLANAEGSSSEKLATQSNALVPSNSISNGALKTTRQRRTRIPLRPSHSLNLWSIMKNCIGKELTKIPMPVNFNEPLSMLQRMTEEFEYADILHKAATIEDSFEQLVYVAAFSVSCYATTSNRTSKPFNPLLGETYECDRRDDLGWRCISEQVMHHPPMLAQHCEGKGWVCWREFAMTSKFRGKYLSVTPIDITHLEFANGNHYTWKKVTTTVHNIIVGKLWVDNHGEMAIVNQKTGDTCHLNFHPYSYFSRDVPRKVTGAVVNKNDEIKWVLQGTWDNKMEAAKVINSSPKLSKGSKPMVETGTLKKIWQRQLPPPEYEKMYNMTVLAVQLNEPEPGVAPTDSRLRPDQRLMEEAKWDEANEAKGRLEDKQRVVRRLREEEAERAAAEGRGYQAYEPIWFKVNQDPVTGNPVHTFTDQYWLCKEKADWSRCPDIYF